MRYLLFILLCGCSLFEPVTPNRYYGLGKIRGRVVTVDTVTTYDGGKVEDIQWIGRVTKQIITNHFTNGVDGNDTIRFYGDTVVLIHSDTVVTARK